MRRPLSFLSIKTRIQTSKPVYWAANAGRLPGAVAGIPRRKREEFARIADEASEWIVSSLTQDDIDRAGLRDKSVSCGIFRDKSAHDAGEPAQVVEHRLVVRRAYDDIRDLFPEAESLT